MADTTGPAAAAGTAGTARGPAGADEDGVRTPLSRERVIEGAVALADRVGVQPLTIRRLAAELGVKPMTIYHHVAAKDAILDGMVDAVFAEIDLPPADQHWKAAIRARSVSARAVLARHPWATPLMESRTAPGPATLHHHEAVLACFRRGGLSIELTAHAYAVVDSFVYGFALQEASLPFGGEADEEVVGAVAGPLVEGLPADAFPHLVEMTTAHVLRPGYSFGASFEVGLDLILDGIERRAAQGR